MNQERMNLLKAYSKTIDSSAFFTDLYGYITLYGNVPENFFLTLETAPLLDMYYFYSHAGQKFISTLIENFYDYENSTLLHRSDIAGMFWALFGDNLIRQWENYRREYEPIENYNMHEIIGEQYAGTDSTTHTGTITDSHSGTITDSGSSTLTKNLYGFNSTDDVPSDTATGTDGNTKTLNNSDTRTNNNTDATTKGSSRTTETTKHGNIGVTTNQKMLRDDIALWQWNFYTKYLFPLVDSVLTLPIY